MAFLFQQHVKVILLLLLSTFGNARVLPKNVESGLLPAWDAIDTDSLLARNTDESLLEPRQTTDVRSCYAPCDLKTCGSSCSIAAANRVARRDFSFLDDWAVANASTHDLHKRLFRIDGSSTTPKLGGYSLQEVSNYLSNQLRNPAYDNQYGVVLDLLYSDPVRGQDARTVSYEVPFAGSGPFQIGTNEIHGCTVVTIVSRRAVWIQMKAHFWEGYTFDAVQVGNELVVLDVPSASGPPPQTFQERVLDVLTGTLVTSGASNYWGPYITPLGPPPTMGYYDQSDNAKAFIMTPLAYDTPGDVLLLRYPNAIAQITATLQSLGIPGSKIWVSPYVALNYVFQGERLEAGTNQRGTVLLQFDPNSNGAPTQSGAQRAWRLFYENGYSSDFTD